MSSTIQTATAPFGPVRREALEEAQHSGDMEGLHVTLATRADGGQDAAERIDCDEFVARVRARCGPD